MPTRRPSLVARPSASHGRSSGPSAPRSPTPMSSGEPPPAASRTRLPASRAATSAPGDAGSTPGGGPAPTNRVRAARPDPGDAFQTYARRDGDQEALSELRDDCERGQPVLLLLRDPVPLTAAKPERCEDRPRYASE